MTNPATPRRTEPAIGNGVATSFPFTFKVFSGADIGVVRTLLATGVDEALTLDVDYSVTLNPDQDASPGGTVTHPISGSPLSSSYSLTIFGDTDYTQDLDLSAGGNFNPVNIENALDRLSFQIQQLLEQLSRTLTLAVSSGSTTDLTLPSPVANGLIGWDSLAMGLQNVDPSTLATLVAYGAAQRDYFVGDGVTTAFALSANPGALGNIDIDIDGVTQHGDTDFSWSGGLNLVFTSAPANLAKIQVRYLQALPVGTVGASTVGTTQLVDGSVTTVKLANASVTTDKIADANVTFSKLSADALASLAALITPPGSVMDFAGEAPPTGWLECDGSSLLRASYPALFAAIGTLHGAADGTHFNIPDHRGKFKRGWAHGTANDPDRTSRTAAAAGGATGDHVGTAQADDFKAHTHNPYLQYHSSTGAGQAVVNAPGVSGPAVFGTTTSTGGNETRPINAAVMSIIKT